MMLTLEKPLPTVAPPNGERPYPPEFHRTVEFYHKAYDAGVFGQDARMELVHGGTLEKMLPGPHHSYLADAIAHMLRVALETRYLVREKKAVHIAFDGEPIPSISVVRGKRADYQERHPAPEEAVLLAEVSDTTVLYDLGGKAELYAQAGVIEYWVVLVNENTVVRHREPTANGYAEVTRLAGGETISPLAAPEVVWTVETLFGQEKQP